MRTQQKVPKEPAISVHALQSAVEALRADRDRVRRQRDALLGELAVVKSILREFLAHSHHDVDCPIIPRCICHLARAQKMLDHPSSDASCR